jgi:hypothetical protein
MSKAKNLLTYQKGIQYLNYVMEQAFFTAEVAEKRRGRSLNQDLQGERMNRILSIAVIVNIL